jgi:hypothetical protein
MLAVVLIVAAVLAVAGGSSSGASSGGGGYAVEKRGISDLRKLCASAGLAEDWTNFFALVAYGESGGNNTVGLGDPSIYPPWTKTHLEWVSAGKPALSHLQRNEANAAVVAYNRAREQGWLPATCWPRVGYVFGSGGWFGLLPANALAAYRETDLVCQHPFTVFDGPGSLVMAIALARRLRQWKQWDGTVLSLRAGWGNPSAMNSADWLASRRPRFAKHCTALGLPESFLEQQLGPIPAFNYPELLYRLGGTVWLPDHANT